MKNYIVSLSKKAFLLGGVATLAMCIACDDGELSDIYKGSSSGEYVSDVNWTDAANTSTGTYIKYFFENAGGRNTFCGSIYWEKPNTPETGEPTSTGGSGGWSQGHALDIVIDAYIRHADDPAYQADLYENIIAVISIQMRLPFISVLVSPTISGSVYLHLKAMARFTASCPAFFLFPGYIISHAPFTISLIIEVLSISSRMVVEIDFPDFIITDCLFAHIDCNAINT